MISDEGEILTNAHVVTDAATTGSPTRPLHEATEIYVQFADRNQVEAEIVGFDPFADVALLKVDPEGLDLQPLPLGSETDVAGRRRRWRRSGARSGRTSRSRSASSPRTDRSIESLTELRDRRRAADRRLDQPRQLGRPAARRLDGEVVGINQQIQTSSGGNEGVGFAVPIDLAERSVDQLRDDGEVAYAYAGVTTQPLYPQLAERLGIDAETGALVAEVVPGSPGRRRRPPGGRRGDPLPGPPRSTPAAT